MVVWAKLEGYPWWPAQIQEYTTPQQRRLKHGAHDYFCVFLGGNDFQWVSPRNVQAFEQVRSGRHASCGTTPGGVQEYARRSKVKRPDLQEAIDAAWAVMGKLRPE